LRMLAMSKAERGRAILMRQVVQQLLSQKAVAERLGIGVRQVKWLMQAWRQESDVGGVAPARTGLATAHEGQDAEDDCRAFGRQIQGLWPNACGLRSCASVKGSQPHARPSEPCQSNTRCGGRNTAGPGGSRRCVNAVPGLANSFRSMAVRMTGSRGVGPAAR